MPKPRLTLANIDKVARLSRLRLTANERQQAAHQLDSILGHFAAIQAIDTKAVPAADDVTGLHNITRDDQAITDQLCAATTLLELSPATQNNQLKVQSVF